MAGPAAITIELTDEERAELTRWTHRRKTSQAFATRARIVLAVADVPISGATGTNQRFIAPVNLPDSAVITT